MRKDKIYHFSICFIVALIIGVLFHPITGALSATFLGIGKEYGDHTSPVNTWSWGDILADAMGMIAGVIIATPLASLKHF